MTEGKRWDILSGEPSGSVHVTPDSDQVMHELSEDCVCLPRVEPVQRPDGTFGWIYVHHSLDGREALEGAA